MASVPLLSNVVKPLEGAARAAKEAVGQVIHKVSEVTVSPTVGLASIRHDRVTSQTAWGASDSAPYFKMPFLESALVHQKVVLDKRRKSWYIIIDV